METAKKAANKFFKSSNLLWKSLALVFLLASCGGEAPEGEEEPPIPPAAAVPNPDFKPSAKAVAPVRGEQEEPSQAIPYPIDGGVEAVDAARQVDNN